MDANQRLFIDCFAFLIERLEEHVGFILREETGSFVVKLPVGNPQALGNWVVTLKETGSNGINVKKKKNIPRKLFFTSTISQTAPD